MLLYDVFYTDEDGNQTLSGTWNDVELARKFCVDHWGVDLNTSEMGEEVVDSWPAPSGEGTITIVERSVDG